MVSLLYILTPGASMIRRSNGSKLRNGPRNERWSILLYAVCRQNALERHRFLRTNSTTLRFVNAWVHFHVIPISLFLPLAKWEVQVKRLVRCQDPCRSPSGVQEGRQHPGQGGQRRECFAFTVFLVLRHPPTPGRGEPAHCPVPAAARNAGLLG